MRKFLFFLVLWPQTPCIEFSYQEKLVVWNIGQGQWVTLIKNENCFHFDAGGEKFPWRKIEFYCGSRNNYFFFSHWDFDHIGAAKNLFNHLGKICIAAMPGGPATSLSKSIMLDELPKCAEKIPPEFVELKWTLNGKLQSNDYSRVWVAEQKILIPGDSTQKQERSWLKKIAQPEKIKYLILGHHGSRTSSAEALIKNLKSLNLGIASARKKRYGHPHKEVVERLKKHKIPMLSTEQWGNIMIEI